MLIWDVISTKPRYRHTVACHILHLVLPSNTSENSCKCRGKCSPANKAYLSLDKRAFVILSYSIGNVQIYYWTCVYRFRKNISHWMNSTEQALETRELNSISAWLHTKASLWCCGSLKGVYKCTHPNMPGDVHYCCITFGTVISCNFVTAFIWRHCAPKVRHLNVSLLKGRLVSTLQRWVVLPGWCAVNRDF